MGAPGPHLSAGIGGLVSVGGGGCQSASSRATPAMPRRWSRHAVQFVVFSRFSPKKNDKSYGDGLHGARHRRGGGGSTLLYTLHHLPRPTPLFPHLNEARRTHIYLGVQSLNSTCDVAVTTTPWGGALLERLATRSARVAARPARLVSRAARLASQLARRGEEGPRARFDRWGENCWTGPVRWNRELQCL